MVVGSNHAPFGPARPGWNIQKRDISMGAVLIQDRTPPAPPLQWQRDTAGSRQQAAAAAAAPAPAPPAPSPAAPAPAQAAAIVGGGSSGGSSGGGRQGSS